MELVPYIPIEVRDIPILFEIVRADFSVLLGLCALYMHGLIVNNVTNRLRLRVVLRDITGEYVDTWAIPLVRFGYHLHGPFATPRHIFYTTAQLKELQKQFAHPSAQKLYQLLKGATINDVTPKCW